MPVLWHDDFISVRRGDGEVENSAIRDLTIEQLKKLSRAAIATAEAAKIGDTRAVKATRSRLARIGIFRTRGRGRKVHRVRSDSSQGGYLSEEECGERADFQERPPHHRDRGARRHLPQVRGHPSPRRGSWTWRMRSRQGRAHVRRADDLGFSLELKFGTPEDFPGGRRWTPEDDHGTEGDARGVQVAPSPEGRV